MLEEIKQTTLSPLVLVALLRDILFERETSTIQPPLGFVFDTIQTPLTSIHTKILVSSTRSSLVKSTIKVMYSPKVDNFIVGTGTSVSNRAGLLAKKILN